jgi:hypothetical protein
MKRILFTGWICLAAILLFGACQKKAPEGPAKIAPRAQGTIIFLDTSMSMRGYFNISPAAGTPIQRFLLADLLEIVAEDSLLPAYLSTFGSEVVAPQKMQSLRKWSFFDSQENRDRIYSQNETNLMSVFEREEFGRHDVSIVISDGIQSSAEGSQNIAGFDTRIFNVIRKRCESGIYLWLIGVKSRFRGTIYPERPCPDGIKRSFHYSGLRPIYIWIGSHEVAKGLNLVRRVVERIHATLDSSETVRVAGLNYVQPPEIDITLDPQSSSSPIKSRGELKKGNFEWLVKKTEGKEVDIPIITGEKTGTIQPSLSNFEWNNNLELSPQNIKWARVLKRGGKWHLILIYKLIPAKGFFTGCRDDNGNLSIIASSVSTIHPKPWWSEWSTEDDWRDENAGKTLYLEKLSRMIEEPLKKKYESGRILMRMDRP